jgi:hypothetical protein
MKHIIAAGIALGFVILAWQVGGVVKAAISASVPRMENMHRDPPADPSMPAVFVLNLASGGSFTCRMAGTTYACTPGSVRYPVRGAR